MAEKNKHQAAQSAQPTQPAQAPAVQPAHAPATQGATATPPAQTAPAAQPAQTAATQAADTAQTDAVQTGEQEEVKHGKSYFIVALVCTALGGLFFGLTFTPLAVYSLLAAILFCISSISFLGAQKKRENFKGVSILKLITYILFALLLAFFIGGVVWSLTA